MPFCEPIEMKKTRSVLITALAVFILSCKEKQTHNITAQQIVDHSIDACGGELYRTANISFDFRGMTYVKENDNGQKILKRIQKNDSLDIVDIKTSKGFERYVDGELIATPDSLANLYGNSINSVHYFAYLPYGLNDPAVNKEYLGDIKIQENTYHKVKVTFNEENGGDDFDDVYLYWFNTKTLKPDYLAYEFHVNGGGMRFREAYNERVVNGIRFVDYRNYKPKASSSSINEIEHLFMNGELELLSKIELGNVQVSPGNYN